MSTTTKKVGDIVLLRDLEPGEAFRFREGATSHHRNMLLRHDGNRSFYSRYSAPGEDSADGSREVLRAQPDLLSGRLAE